MAFAKMKMPTFTGLACDYPEFKKLWRMVDAEDNPAQSFHFMKNEAMPAKFKDKIKICPNLSAAWAKHDDEFGQADVVTLSVVEALAKLSFKSHTNHEQFQELYDAWRRCEADLKEIGKEACLRAYVGQDGHGQWTWRSRSSTITIRWSP